MQHKTKLQTLAECEAMRAELTTANTLAELGLTYARWVCYDFVQDNPEMPLQDVRAHMSEYIEEVRADAMRWPDGT